MTTLDAALQQFEATEANLDKLEKLWNKIQSYLPSGPTFGSPPEYDELCFAFRGILSALPAIDGVRVEDRLFDYDQVGQMHLDALELGEIEARISVEKAVTEQGRLLQAYRFKLRAKRRELVRSRMSILINEVDELLRSLGPTTEGKAATDSVSGSAWSRFKASIAELDTLLGSSERTRQWDDLWRHIHYETVRDLLDIEKRDWPPIKKALHSNLYGQHDPVPVHVADLGDLVAARPQGPVATQLEWSALSDEDFERLIFQLIDDTPGYENPEWLQHTYAPDCGRDLSVTRVENDPLGGVRRYRMIIQCKHWLSKSVNARDVNEIRGQMELWQPPRVDGLIIATTGRFTADAVRMVENHNQADRALHIYIWPESHIERLLAARPHLIGQFRLRRTN